MYLFSLFSSAISSILMVACLVFPVVFLLQLPPLVQEIISTVGFFVAAEASLNALFMPKMYSLYCGHDIDKNLEIKRSSTKTSGSDIVHPNLPANANHSAAIMAGSAALKNLSTEQRIEVCQLQLEHWKALQMYYGDRVGSGDGDGSGKSSGNGSATASGSPSRNASNKLSVADLSLKSHSVRSQSMRSLSESFSESQGSGETKDVMAEP